MRVGVGVCMCAHTLAMGGAHWWGYICKTAVSICQPAPAKTSLFSHCLALCMMILVACSIKARWTHAVNAVHMLEHACFGWCAALLDCLQARLCRAVVGERAAYSTCLYASMLCVLMPAFMMPNFGLYLETPCMLMLTAFYMPV
jgi:hypothetical protein